MEKLTPEEQKFLETELDRLNLLTSSCSTWHNSDRSANRLKHFNNFYSKIMAVANSPKLQCVSKDVEQILNTAQNQSYNKPEELGKAVIAAIECLQKYYESLPKEMPVVESSQAHSHENIPQKNSVIDTFQKHTDKKHSIENVSQTSKNAKNIIPTPETFSESLKVDTIPVVSKKETPQFDTTYTRKDGSKIKIIYAPDSSISNLYSMLHAYRIIQQFPNHNDIEMENIVLSPREPELFLGNADVDSYINGFLSAQNIYKFATQQYGLAYVESTDKSYSTKEYIEYLEKDCRTRLFGGKNFLPNHSYNYVLSLANLKLFNNAFTLAECGITLHDQSQTETDLLNSRIIATVITGLNREKLYDNPDYMNYFLQIARGSFPNLPKDVEVPYIGSISENAFIKNDFHCTCIPEIQDIFKSFIDYLSQQQELPEGPSDR